MRDPAGHIDLQARHVLRTLHAPAGGAHFLRSPLAARWVARGDLIAYEWLDERTLKSPRLPMVIYPHEWTAVQFHLAAELTLKLQAEAVAEGWDLKDASAWNVVFVGLRPVFVDLLSFELLRQRVWRAAGQFSRHFLLPLLLEKRHRLEARQCFQLWRDGAPPVQAARLIGPGRYVTRYWPLMMEGAGEANATQPSAGAAQASSMEALQNFRIRLQTSLSWMLEGLNPQVWRTPRSTWRDYEGERNHYDASALAYKRTTVKRWLQAQPAEWVLDVGCNRGEFSQVAAEAGACVVCWDSDTQALTQLCREQAKGPLAQAFYPVLGPVDDVNGGRGWRGTEFSGLPARLEGQFDGVLLLAVIHHLAIAGGVPLTHVFRWMRRCTRQWAVVELLEAHDPRLQQLCQHYGRDPGEFSWGAQLLAAQDAGFVVRETAQTGEGRTRGLVLMEVAV